MALILLLISLIIGCSNHIPHEDTDLLFNEWYDNNFHPGDSIITTSPNAKFAVEYSWENPDASDKQALFLFQKGSGRKILVGRSSRGIKVNWVATQIGAILMIEHPVDTHFVESFVIYPQISKTGELFFSKLYATPDLNFHYGHIPLEHIYSSIKEISPDGIMTLHLTWDFGSQDQEGNTMNLQIPLFYGAKTRNPSPIQSK